MPMLSLARNGFTAAQVQKALHAPWGSQLVTFRFDLLDQQGTLKGTLRNVTDASVNHDALGDIKRKARFTLRDDGAINYLSDRIKPWAQVYVPPRIMPDHTPTTGGWAEFPLGVFLLSTPEEGFRVGGTIRDIEAYDQGIILMQGTVDGRYLIPSGTKFTDALANIFQAVGITRYNITPTAKTLPVDREWDRGATYLSIINELLKAMNYYSVWFDGDGYAICAPYVLPSLAPSEYTYAEGDMSVIRTDSLTRRKDLFNVPNKWVYVVSQADREELKSVYVNDSANSPLSTGNRGITIVDNRTVDAADQATLDGLVQRAAQDASQVYETVTWDSILMPHHNHMDNYTLSSSQLGGAFKFRETSWAMELKAGGTMSHSARRTVTI